VPLAAVVVVATLAIMAMIQYGSRLLTDPIRPWNDLAAGFQPRPLADVVAELEHAAGRDPAVSFAGLGITLSETVAPGDWRTGAGPGHWITDLPGGAFRSAASDALRLEIEGRVLLRAAAPSALEPGRFAFDGRTVHLQLAPDDRAPTAELVGRLENGAALDGVWSLRIGQRFAPGIPVWTGGREVVRVGIAGESRLDFRFVYGGQHTSERVRYRVTLDGEPILERECSADEAATGRFESLVLPPEQRRRATLAFEFEGAQGLGAFLTPRLAPAWVGQPGRRPWPETRPDLIVFLADTFRADNLAMYGGDPTWTPNLDRLSRRALRFLEARSVAAWTLPSISTLLTGLLPAHHGAVEEGGEHSALTPEVETLPERLARAGYRVGAITDGSFFSPVFGLQQGFEWFSWREESGWSTARTLAEARDFLARDDGRPLFLVVHTYRTHQPYRRGPQEDGSEYRSIEAAQRAEVPSARPPIEVVRAQALKHAPELAELYRAGVQDLDRMFDELFTTLDSQDYFEHGYLVFTSDHGEALGEHGDMFHGGHLWEPKLRIPLLLWGPEATPEDVGAPASLLDVPRTLGDLAGLPHPETWLGQSLFDLPSDRRTFAFQLTQLSRQVAVVHDGRKLILTPDEERLRQGSPDEAFDLRTDPEEADNRAGAEEWPTRMLHEPDLALMLLEFTTLRGSGASAQISPELQEALDNIGYGGG
jgi:arylsulfatase A-like enzyme